eukprot:1158529-Pelagomonas_calceolata.AAC.12
MQCINEVQDKRRRLSAACQHVAYFTILHEDNEDGARRIGSSLIHQSGKMGGWNFVQKHQERGHLQANLLGESGANMENRQAECLDAT